LLNKKEFQRTASPGKLNPRIACARLKEKRSTIPPLRLDRRRDDFLDLIGAGECRKYHLSHTGGEDTVDGEQNWNTNKQAVRCGCLPNRGERAVMGIDHKKKEDNPQLSNSLTLRRKGMEMRPEKCKIVSLWVGGAAAKCRTTSNTSRMNYKLKTGKLSDKPERGRRSGQPFHGGKKKERQGEHRNRIERTSTRGGGKLTSDGSYQAHRGNGKKDVAEKNRRQSTFK